MADPQLTEQLSALDQAIQDWQQALIDHCQCSPGDIGELHPDGGIGGPIHNGFRLIVAPASRRACNLAFGLDSLNTGPALRANQPDRFSGWDYSNRVLAAHFARHDGFSHGPHAMLYCRSLGPDWYLPARDELKVILAIAHLIDRADPSGPCGLFRHLDDTPIWTSSPAPDGHWTLRASDGQLAAHNLRNEGWVIPVRRIALP